MLAVAVAGLTFDFISKLLLLILGVLILVWLARYLEAKDRERQGEARRLRSAGWRRRLVADGSRGFCEDCGARSDLGMRHRSSSQGAETPDDLVPLCRHCDKARRRGDRTMLDWTLLAMLKWWRIRRYRRSARAA